MKIIPSRESFYGYLNQTESRNFVSNLLVAPDESETGLIAKEIFLADHAYGSLKVFRKHMAYSSLNP